MPRSRKIIELEALRGIAAIVVLVHHFMLGFMPRLHGLLYPQQPHSIFGTPLFGLVNGSAAVIVFFVLSGFVLSLGVLRTRRLSVALLAGAKRWPRLSGTVIPANLIAVGLMAGSFYANTDAASLSSSIWLGWFYAWPNEGMAEWGFGFWEGATTFLTGVNSYNANLWTMFYEFWGSLVTLSCAFVVCLAPNKPSRHAVLAVAWIAALIVSPLVSTFVVGVALAMIHEDKGFDDWGRSGIVAAAAALLLLAGYHENLGSMRAEGIYAFLNPLVEHDPLRVRILVHTVVAALAIMLVLRAPTLRKWLSGQVGAFLGFVSFGIYLVQMIVICTLSSWIFVAFESSRRILQLSATFLVTLYATFLLALPIACFDRWWMRTVNKAAGFLHRAPTTPSIPSFKPGT